MDGFDRSAYKSAYDDAAQYYGQQNPYAQQLGFFDSDVEDANMVVHGKTNEGDEDHDDEVISMLDANEGDSILNSKGKLPNSKKRRGKAGTIGDHRRVVGGSRSRGGLSRSAPPHKHALRGRSSSQDGDDDYYLEDEDDDDYDEDDNHSDDLHDGQRRVNSKIRLSSGNEHNGSQGSNHGARRRGGSSSSSLQSSSSSYRSPRGGKRRTNRTNMAPDRGGSTQDASQGFCTSISRRCKRLYIRLFPEPCNVPRSILFNNGRFGRAIRANQSRDRDGGFGTHLDTQHIRVATKPQPSPSNSSRSPISSPTSSSLSSSKQFRFTQGQDDADTHNSHATQGIEAIQSTEDANDAIAYFPSNAVNNQKYSMLNFIPLFLFFEFRFFFNLYFLVVALTQFVPALQVGFLFTYVAPLCVVMAVSMAKEAYDDIQRHRRDRLVNHELYARLVVDTDHSDAHASQDQSIWENANDAANDNNEVKGRGEYYYEDGAKCQKVRARDLKVGDLIVLYPNQRVPSDCVLLRTIDSNKKNNKSDQDKPDEQQEQQSHQSQQSDDQGTCFIRTDQLDGETDWKSRRAILATQKLRNSAMLLKLFAELNVETPKLDIYDFIGNFKFYGDMEEDMEMKKKADRLQTNKPTRSFVAPPLPAAVSSSASASSSSTSVTVSPTSFSIQYSHEDEDEVKTELNDVKQSGEYIHPTIITTPPLNPDVSSPHTQQERGQLTIDANANFKDETTPTTTIEALTLENTLWASTAIASASTVIACVIYTGLDTRASRNASPPTTKTGLLDLEVNNLSKLLFIITMLLAFVMTMLKGLTTGDWYIYLFRFVLLLSSIIPISLRVNLDLGKTYYSLLMMRDDQIPETVVRTSTIPEELGRLSYLFTDKTGTLTCNMMVFKSIVLGPCAGGAAGGGSNMLTYTQDRLEELIPLLRTATWNMGEPVTSSASSSTMSQILPPTQIFSSSSPLPSPAASSSTASTMPALSPAACKVRDMLLAIALCHNVTPVLADSSKHKNNNGEGNSNNSSNSQQDSNLLKDESHGVWHDDEHKDGDSEESKDASSSSSSEHQVTEYQASSPDEVALVKFSESVGLRLIGRTHTSITLLTPRGYVVTFEILAIFPFTSETKRMGIILREKTTQNVDVSSTSNLPNSQENASLSNSTYSSSSASASPAWPSSSSSSRIVFYLKGAESVMKPRCLSNSLSNEWLDEELLLMASTGLRTLVYGRKVLTEQAYATFASQLTSARTLLEGRDEAIRSTMSMIEYDLQLLGITGVDDRLQYGVAECLERLRDASIRTWMLTGDKAETAACIGRSSRLVAPTQRIFPVIVSSSSSTSSTSSSNVDGQYDSTAMADEANLFRQLNHFSGLHDACLLIDGSTLQLALNQMPKLFLKTACKAPSVICCRCSPTQKAQVVSLMKQHLQTSSNTHNTRVCAIGDGGNDVAMIQAADVGIGIFGVEGRQAAMAADFSITQFAYLERLVLWHGRNSYKRSARLAQFVMHRGLIISIIQAVFSALFFFVAVPIYNGWLMVGYTTIYTMLPVFSLVLDQDIDEESASLYPQLYTDLQKGRPLSFKTFFMWLFLSVYQGGLIMILAIIVFESSIVNIVAITFTALVMCELVNVALSIHRWTRLMIAAEIVSAISYFVSILVLRSYFDLVFVLTWSFAWKTAAITAACTLPPAFVTKIVEIIHPARHAKVRNVVAGSSYPYQYQRGMTSSSSTAMGTTTASSAR